MEMRKRFTYVLGALSLCALLSACGGETYPVVDSGQTACYEADITTGETGEIDCPSEGQAFYGQDAQTSNNPIDLTNNEDGTITDNVTGLVWQQTPPTGVDDGFGEGFFSYSQAVDYCDALELGGRDDWRVPIIKELYSISDFGTGWPYIDTEYFDLAYADGPGVDKSEQYWGQLYIGHTEEGAWDAALGVNHATGHIKAYPNGDAAGPEDEATDDAVAEITVAADDTVDAGEPPAGGPPSIGKRLRCISGGDGSYGVNAFTDNHNGTISDTATGLMWQKFDNEGQTMSWEEALSFAESAKTGGHKDWRLPSTKELQSIVDYTRSPTADPASEDYADHVGPAIDTDYFVLTPIDHDMTNTWELYGTEDYGYYWTSTSAYFNPMSPENIYAWYIAFGTAVNNQGNDYHGAGAARFDTKQILEDSVSTGDPERGENYVLLVRDIDYEVKNLKKNRK